MSRLCDQNYFVNGCHSLTYSSRGRTKPKSGLNFSSTKLLRRTTQVQLEIVILSTKHLLRLINWHNQCAYSLMSSIFNRSALPNIVLWYAGGINFCSILYCVSVEILFEVTMNIYARKRNQSTKTVQYKTKTVAQVE